MKDTPALKTLFGLLFRGALISLGGYGIAESVSPADLEAISGAAAIVGGLVWSYFEKKAAARKLAQAK